MYHRYKSVDGRVYELEDSMIPEHATPSDKELQLMTATRSHISVTKIYAMEQFLQGKSLNQQKRPNRKECREIIDAYHLGINALLKNHGTTDKQAVYQKLCERLPQAACYGSYQSIIHALYYGKAS